MEQPTFLRATSTPLEDIEKISYPGQAPEMKQYRMGYDYFLNEMPHLHAHDRFLNEKLNLSRSIIKNLAYELTEKGDGWIYENNPGENGFSRTIIALEKPIRTGYTNSLFREGAELIVAKWGVGKSSPIHGHAPGLLHEEILFGRIRVNSYRIVDKVRNIVRLVQTEIVSKGTFLSKFTQTDLTLPVRSAYVHNFTAIDFSASLHYIPEHTRDGRDNGFKAEYFDERLTPEDVKQIDSKQGMYLPVGEVLLVRSTNVPEYGDHYIVITGAPVLKEHGLRPQDTAIAAPEAGDLLNAFPMKTGVTLLQLKPQARDLFLNFHGIERTKTGVTFPSL
jgi:hypothetical protein